MPHAFFGVFQPALPTQHLRLEAAAVMRRLDYSSAYDCGRQFSGPSLKSPRCRFDLATHPVKVCIPDSSVCNVACHLVREVQWATKVHILSPAVSD
jgi:hypothetical protein